MQREQVLEHALHVLEDKGLANTTLEMVAGPIVKRCFMTRCVI